jgi:branched-chain amino acid transport system substrate-binding protein
LARRGLPALALAALALGVVGCGSGGVAKDATLNVYVSAPLSGAQAVAGKAMCAAAKAELARHGGKAGDFKLRVTCLDDAAGGPHWTLAAVGADARRAVEDSATIAYIGELEAAPTRFSRPIVEAAGIGQVSGAESGQPMERVIKAIEAAGGTEQLREAVSEELSGS